MSQKLPVDGFKWYQFNENEKFYMNSTFNEKFIKMIQILI